MAPSHLHSILARSLTDPEFLSEVRRDPNAAMAPYQITRRQKDEFALLARSKLKDFASFVTMVQHNYLWDVFPYSRKLLRHYQLEFKVFAACGSEHHPLRNSKSKARADKIRAFFSNAIEVLKAETCVALKDTLVHEFHLWELTQQAKPRRDCKQRECPDCDDLLLSRETSLRTEHYFRCPTSVAGLVSLGEFDFSDVPSQTMAYWVDGRTNQIRLAVIDELVEVILQAAEGPTRIVALARTVAASIGAPDEEAGVRESVMEAVSLGILVPGEVP